MTGFDTSGLVAYVDGAYVPASEATVSIFDHGLLYGDGIFEGMRLFSGRLFRPRDHFARLRRSAAVLQLEVPLADDALLTAVSETLRRSHLSDAHVRIILTRGFGTPGLDPWRCEKPTLVIAAYPFPPLLGREPLRLMISSTVRKAPRSLGAHVKSLNYLDAIVAKQQARACGMGDAVMLDHLGAVAECTSTNLFVLRDGTLATPTTRAALPGITRLTVLEIAPEIGIAAHERDVWPDELAIAEAAFVTGSGAGIVPVGSVDGRELPSGGSEVVERIAEAYRARTKDERFSVAISSEATAR